MYILDTNLAANGATTQFAGISLDSMAKFGEQQFLAASSSGLFLLGGDHDTTSTDISAYFITATMDFGINSDKHIRYAVISLESTDNLRLTVNTEKVSAQTYTIAIRPGLGQQHVKVIISRSMYGRFWTFKIDNAETGADFSIDEIKILPVIRTLTR